MSTVARYMDKYAKKTQDSPKKLGNLMSDRQAYISFLEVQLEKVTQSVKMTGNFDERIESVQAQVNGCEDKIVNVKRIVKLQQSYSESQEEDFNTLREKVENLQKGDQRSQMFDIEESLRGRMDALERRLTSPTKPRKMDNITIDVEKEMRRVETRMIDMMSSMQTSFESRLAQVEKNMVEQTGEFQFLEKRIADRPAGTGLSESIRSRNFDPLEDRLVDLEQELNLQKDLIKSMEMELPRIQTTSINSERTCARVADDSMKLTQKIKADIAKIEQLCVATAEEMRDRNTENKKPKLDLGSFEKKIDAKVTKAINGMHDLMKKYIGVVRQQDAKKQALSNQKTKKKLHQQRSPISAAGTLNFLSSHDDPPLLDTCGDSISNIKVLGTDQTDNELQTILAPTNERKKSKRNKSSNSKSTTSKPSRSITPRPRSQRIKHSRSSNVSLRLSPVPSSKTMMESSTKKSVKKKNKKEVKQKKATESESAKELGGTETRLTDRRNRLEKIYQEITDKRRK